MRAKWLRVAVSGFSIAVLGALSMKPAHSQGGVPAPPGSTQTQEDANYQQGYNEGYSKGRDSATQAMSDREKAVQDKEKAQQQGGCCA